jgi:hypothetical protein
VKGMDKLNELFNKFSKIFNSYEGSETNWESKIYELKQLEKEVLKVTFNRTKNLAYHAWIRKQLLNTVREEIKRLIRNEEEKMELCMQGKEKKKVEYSIFCKGYEETARIRIKENGEKEFFIADDVAMKKVTEDEMKEFMNKISWCETSWSKKLVEEYRKFKEILS